MSERYARNPIMPGFYPDPSICRVGNDFYMVHSSFCFFPGIPVMHSRDLINWKQIGSAMDRASQLPLDGAGHSRGLFAPSIRHHNGVFYILCTNVDHGGNFIITAEKPEGPWSEPYWLKDAPGIDPSIFFDDDGRAYYIGTRPAPEGPKYDGNWEAWLCELDLKTMSLKGETHGLWRGALRDSIWPEGPHIYKKDGWYYLMIAEGGTGLDHAICIARSRELHGPWRGKPSNPVLTHRHLGKQYPIINVGHGDLVDDAKGNWWMVLLASRPYGGLYCNMGRETFLVPVRWEDEWPFAAPGIGLVMETFTAPDLEECRFEEPACREDFGHETLPVDWLLLRTPREKSFTLTERPGHLRLFLRAPSMRDKAQTSFAGRRQQHYCFECSTATDFVPQSENESAGLVIMQNNDFQYRLQIVAKNGSRIVQVIKAAGQADEIIAETVLTAEGEVILIIEANYQQLGFYYKPKEAKNRITIAEKADATILSTETAGGFVGTVMGIFASANGNNSNRYADFDWFEYRGLDE